MAPRLSGQTSIFGVVFFVSKSLSRIEGQKKLKICNFDPIYTKLDRDTKLAQAIDAMTARAKRIYVLMMKVKKLFSFFLSRCFLKEEMFFVFLSNYRNTKKRFGRTRKCCGNTRLRLLFPRPFSFSQTSTIFSITR